MTLSRHQRRRLSGLRHYLRKAHELADSETTRAAIKDILKRYYGNHWDLQGGGAILVVEVFDGVITKTRPSKDTPAWAIAVFSAGRKFGVAMVSAIAHKEKLTVLA